MSGGTGEHSLITMNLRGSTRNGDDTRFAPFAGTDIFPQVIGPGQFNLVGNMIAANRVTGRNRQVDLSATQGVIPPTNVQYWVNPAPKEGDQFLGQEFDGVFEGTFMNHMSLPFYVRGGIGLGAQFSPNVLEEIAFAFA